MRFLGAAATPADKVGVAAAHADWSGPALKVFLGSYVVFAANTCFCYLRKTVAVDRIRHSANRRRRGGHEGEARPDHSSRKTFAVADRAALWAGTATARKTTPIVPATTARVEDADTTGSAKNPSPEANW